MAVGVMTPAMLENLMPVTFKDAIYFGPGVSGGNVNRVAYSNDALYRNIVTNVTYQDGTTLLRSGIFDEPFDVERIEIIRGPSGTVFGPGNFGGLSNRVTKQPLFAKRSEVRFGFGDNGFMKVAADVTGPVPNTDGKLAFRAVAAYSKGPFSDRAGDNYIHDFIHLSARWAPSPNTTVTANFKYRVLNANLNLMSDYMEGTTFASIYKFNTDLNPLASAPYKTHYTELMAWFTLQRNVGDWLSLRTLAAVMKGVEDTHFSVPTPGGGYNPTPFVTVPGPLPAGMINGVFDWYNTPSRSSGIDQDILVKFAAAGIDTKTLVTFNVQGLRSDDGGGQNRRRMGFYSFFYKNGPIGTPTEFNPYDPSNAYYRDPSTTPVVSLVKNQTKPSLSTTIQEFVTLWKGKVNLSGGFTHSVQHGSEINTAGTTVTKNTKDFSANILRYGVTARPISWATVYAQYNEGFQPPTPRVDPINRTVFGPLTAKNKEAGVRLYFLKDHLSLQANVFRMDLDGIITGFPSTVTQGSFQSGGITNNGWETSLQGEITPQWSITASANRSDYILANGQRVPLSARDYGNIYTNYTFARGSLKDLSIGVGMWYKFRMVDAYPGGVERDYPAAQVWMATAQYHWKKLTFRVNVENLFNKFYYNAQSSGVYFRGDTRHITFTMDCRF